MIMSKTAEAGKMFSEELAGTGLKGDEKLAAGTYSVEEVASLEDAEDLVLEHNNDEAYLVVGGVISADQLEKLNDAMKMIGGMPGRLVVMRKAETPAESELPALKRRSKVLQVKDLEIDLDRFEVRRGAEQVRLTYSEFHTIRTLAEHPGRVFSRDALINSVHGERHNCTPRAVDVVVNGLRKKLGDSADCVETVRGVGYRVSD